MLSKRLGTFCAVALGCAPLFCMAANFNVNNPTEFQTALTTAQANGESDTINVGAGTFDVASIGTLTYTAAATENFGLTITGGPQALAILDGGAQVPILRIDSTAVTNDGGVFFQVENLTFRNGNAVGASDNGGALAILTDESLQPAEFATLISVTGSEFFDNTADADGGAIYIRGHAVEGIYLSDLTVDGNQASGDGGGAYVTGGQFTTPINLSNIDFFDNLAAGSGGGLLAGGFDPDTASEDRNTSISLFDILFYNNESQSLSGGGGGADLSSLDINIAIVGFVDNTANLGGGLRIRPAFTTIAMVNSGFTGNTAGDEGGGLAAGESPFASVTLTNNTFFANDATNRGGGISLAIDNGMSFARIYNNIIWGNTASAADDDLYINNSYLPDIPAVVEIFNNDITAWAVTPGPVSSGSNIDQDPMFANMALRPEPDPRLMAGSPAIDTGDDGAPSRPTNDFEFDARPFDGDGDTVATTDMGMDEFTGAPALNADLAVTKTDTPDPVVEGSDIVYTVTVTNNGPGDATTVTLVDSLDALVSFVSATPSQGTCNENAGTVTCDLLNLGNGATVTTTITVATPDVAEPTMVSNTANVSALENDPVSTNDSATEQTTIVPTGPAMADLALTKSDSPDPVFSGGPSLTYTITVDNNGPDAATGVTLSDSLPAGVTFQSASANSGQCDALPDGNGILGCDLGDLAVNATAIVTIVVVPDTVAVATAITNTATVTGTEQDPTPGNNTATEDTTVNAPAADMSISTSSSPAAPMINEPVTFSMTVTNNGPSDNTGVVAVVALPVDGTFVSGTIDQGSCDLAKANLICTIGDMAAGAVVNATIVVTAPGEPTTLTLTATISADVEDPVTGNDTDSEAVTVIDVVDITVQGTSEGSGSTGWLTLVLLIAVALLTAVRRLQTRNTIPAHTSAIGPIGIILIGLMLPAGDVQAQGDWYVGANIGYAELDYDATDLQQDLANLGWTVSNANVDSSSTAWKAYAGFAPSRYIAFEVGYTDLGKVVTQYSTSIPPNDIDAILSDTYSVHPYQGDGWFGAIVARWPVNPDVITLYARAGAFAWQADLDILVISGGTGSVLGDESGTDMMYGLGFEWHINPAWSLVAEWERYELNEWLDVPSLGMKFRF